MSKKENCWEAMQCGREPGGAKVDDLGVCPAATATEFDGVNGGQAGGRFCWAVAGTLCKGELQGEFAKKFKNCLQCQFFTSVSIEEGRKITLTLNDFKANHSK